jgi:cell wall-associated NlpC family hydrolase
MATACASTGTSPKPFPLPGDAPSRAAAGAAGGPITSVPVAAGAAPIVDTALQLRGTPYRDGGSTPQGFDCSGFTQWVFAQHGLRLPREVRDQFTVGQSIDSRTLQPGDLLFFATTGSGASHVAIALGGDRFVHAPSSNGVVRVEQLTLPYWSRRFLGVRRILAD